ncbi:MAG: hypothetical protein ABEJ75_03545, partial [Candidatus Nanohaloarchaea archaeon]
MLLVTSVLQVHIKKIGDLVEEMVQGPLLLLRDVLGHPTCRMWCNFFSSNWKKVEGSKIVDVSNICMRLVLPPEDPDLDGAASAYGYAEYLTKKDGDATAAAFGEPEEEARDAFEEIDEKLSNAKYYVYSADEVTLVSASSMENVSSRIGQEKVTEVIDHVADSVEDFTEAEEVIDEEYSTAAAIVAKKFRDSEVEISRESATLLYRAMEAAEEANDSDREIADWLEEQL